MTAPRAFISYSHDSAQHKEWVLNLGKDLCAVGIDVELDQWGLAPGRDVTQYMERGIADADNVIMVCTTDYVKKAESGLGGVAYERLIVTNDIVRNIDTIKFIPILRSSEGQKLIPDFLGPRLWVDFRDDNRYGEGIEDLARRIHGIPKIPKPSLGENPFSGKPISIPGRNGENGKSLNSDWFLAQQKRATEGFIKQSLPGLMEFRFQATLTASKSQIELLTAVRSSEIRTFGWPIGVCLMNRPEFKPQPFSDGIRAEVAISDPPPGRNTYDYWALRFNSDFYLLQSLFEDMRTEKRIFFDTRIVRTTECLMFAENVCKKLGLDLQSKIGVRLRHAGLSGRSLIAISPNRWIEPTNAVADEAESEIQTTLGSMQRTRVDDVQALLEPLFMLFEFQQFDRTVYEEIVRNFEKGII